MKRLRRLWLGEPPLGEAFWTCAITGELALNLANSVLILITVKRQ